MIITNQDKNNVINYDNIKSLWIEDNVLDETNTAFYINADEDFLGEYKTEERAKEVLKEITEFWKNGAMTDCKGFICYEMPKE